MSALRGLIGYPITPFDADDSVDLQLLSSIVNDLVVGGSDAVAPLGSAGVLPYLNDTERDSVLTTTLETVNGRVPILAGVSALTTGRAVRHARRAATEGASALMVIPMTYWTLTRSEIVNHFEALSAATDLPIVLYNNPGTAGVHLGVDGILSVVENARISAVKEGTGNIQRLQTLRRVLPNGIKLYNGSNPMAFAAYSAAGADGWCSAAPQVIPAATRAFQDAIDKGDLQGAGSLFQRLLPLLELLVQLGLPRSVVAFRELQGLPAGHLRQPLLPVSKVESKKLKNALSIALASDQAPDAA